MSATLDKLNAPAALATPQFPPAPIGRPITLPCPMCGAEEAAIAVNLWRLGDNGQDAFICGECDNEFSVNVIRKFLERWTPVLAWLHAAPAMEE
jgi:hypothetical protein